MKQLQVKPRHMVLAATVAFLIAALLFAGVLLPGRLGLRVALGVVWTLGGLGLSSRYTEARLRAREREVEALRASVVARASEAAAQEERHRLARNLHDSIKQQLYGISSGAAAADARWERDPAGARAAVSDVRRAAQEAMVEMNALLQQLSPAPLERVGLRQSLQEQGEALGYRTDAMVTVSFGPLPSEDAWPAGAQESLFRVAQEALSNIARHARAHEVRLTVGQEDPGGPVVLEIRDDGQGFVPTQEGGGMGLETMRQRAQSMGGALTIDTAPGAGTVVRVTIPVIRSAVTGETTPDESPAVANRVSLIGLVGGVALALLLLYPVAIVLPGRTATAWPIGLPALGLALAMMAVATATGCGYVAARWCGPGPRRGGALVGAAAGAIAGAVLYLGLVGAGATVVGGRELVAHGIAPVSGRAQLVELLGGALVGIIRWTQGAFWAALLVGSGLGALGGGLVAPNSAAPARAKGAAHVGTILTLLNTSSAIALVVAVASFTLVAPTLRAGLRQNDVGLAAVPGIDAIGRWPIGTLAALYLLGTIGFHLMQRAEIGREEGPIQLRAAQARATYHAALALGIPTVLAALSTSQLQGATVLPLGLMDVLGLPHAAPASIAGGVGPATAVVGLGGILAAAGLALATARAAHRRRRALGHEPPSFGTTGLAIGGLLGLAIASWSANMAGLQVLPLWIAFTVIAAVAVAARIGRSNRFDWRDAMRVVTTEIEETVARLIHAGAGAVAAGAIPTMGLVTASVGMGLMPVPWIEGLAGRQGPGGAIEITPAEVVRQLFLDQAQAALLTLVASLAVIGLLILLLSGLSTLGVQWFGLGTDGGEE